MPFPALSLIVGIASVMTETDRFYSALEIRSMERGYRPNAVWSPGAMWNEGAENAGPENDGPNWILVNLNISLVGPKLTTKFRKNRSSGSKVIEI
jgi:hypothetical protein